MTWQDLLGGFLLSVVTVACIIVFVVGSFALAGAAIGVMIGVAYYIGNLFA